MPQDAPSATELLEAVAEFLDEARGHLDGRLAFHARVAANALGIVTRELELGSHLDDVSARRARALLERAGPDSAGAGDAVALEREVARRIRDGSLDARQPDVVAHVRATVWEKLAIAHPGYAPAVPPAGAAEIDAGDP